MSLTFISEFQNQIYTVLLADEEIKASVKKVYFGAVQDGKCPFLLISIKKAEDLSRHVENIYSIEFQIAAYAKDHHHKLLVSLADKVIKALDKSKIFFAGYKVAGVKANDIRFEKAKDLVLNRLVINYKALIKKENYE